MTWLQRRVVFAALALACQFVMLCDPAIGDSEPVRGDVASSVVIVAPSSNLLEATQHALRPWDISVTAIEARGAAPSESMPGARDRARQLCEQHDARAVVWLTSNRDGNALWLFDMETDRVVVRKLTVELPLHEAGAAAVALSIKTLLMHTEAAPPTERFGSSNHSSPLATAPTESSKAPARRWSALSTVALRHGLGDGPTDLRFGLGLYRHLGAIRFGGRVASGPGYAVEAPGIRGHFTDWSFASEVHTTATWHDFEWLAGLTWGVHRTRLSGTLTEVDTPVAATRYNPSIGTRLGLERSIGATSIGLGARLRYLTRRQRYLVADSPVLQIPTWELETSLFIRVPL